jgi:hypothetical protein
MDMRIKAENFGIRTNTLERSLFHEVLWLAETKMDAERGNITFSKHGEREWAKKWSFFHILKLQQKIFQTGTG